MLLNNSTFRLMQDVLDREHPAHFTLPSTATMEQRAGYQQLCEGYNLALANLESFGISAVEDSLPESTYEPPEVDNT